jgi:hypothetical protein
MSKLQDRLPALATPEERLLVTTSVLDDVEVDGRVERSNLVDAVEKRIAQYEINQSIVEREARKAMANQLVTAWANSRSVKFDRRQRVPVYQLSLGFDGSYFKVGSTYVRSEAVTLDDLDVMIERIDHRVDNALTDKAILTELRDRARPGLEAGQNLVQQLDAGTLQLFGVNGDEPDEPEALGAGEGDDDTPEEA